MKFRSQWITIRIHPYYCRQSKAFYKIWNEFYSFKLDPMSFTLIPTSGLLMGALNRTLGSNCWVGFNARPSGYFKEVLVLTLQSVFCIAIRRITISFLLQNQQMLFLCSWRKRDNAFFLGTLPELIKKIHVMFIILNDGSKKEMLLICVVRIFQWYSKCWPVENNDIQNADR